MPVTLPMVLLSARSGKRGRPDPDRRVPTVADVDVAATELATLAASIATSALGVDTLPGSAEAITARVLRRDFTRRQAHAARAHGCTRPVRLRGNSTTVDTRTGAVAGLSAREVADQLGHAKPSMTQDVYLSRRRPCDLAL